MKRQPSLQKGNCVAGTSANLLAYKRLTHARPRLGSCTIWLWTALESRPMMIRAPGTLIPASLVLVACATLGGIRSEPLDNGVASRFPVPFDSVMAVVPEAVVAAGLGLKESQCYARYTCMVIGTRGFSLSRSGSLGSMARVVVEAAGDETIVRVLSRRRIAKQTQAREDYASEILSQIEVRLGLTPGT